MRDWKRLHSTNTYKEMIDLWNKNIDSSVFIDSMVGTILCNGVLFQGTETIDGIIIKPLEKVEVSGVVQSNTILDNFTLYYRDTNNIVTLNKFPIDLLSYANGKPQFLYIKEDLTYRVSDYMFGGADEILLARFVINTDSTWNQLYIMAQRAGTPMYNAGDEFYDIDGMYVKSPGGLELSQTSGTAKRSGIDFTDRISPDIYQFYNLATERVPLRYINNLNEVDYTQELTYNIQPNKYMVYNMNKQFKIEAEEYIRIIQNLYYGIESYSNSVAMDLHDAIVVGGDQSDLKQIVDSYVSYINKIYLEVDNLYNLLGEEILNSVRRAGLLENRNLVYTYINKNLIVDNITESQVNAIRTIPVYVLNINLLVCPNPLENILQEIQDDLNEIIFDAGKILDVPNGKYTIQRVLWDIYEQSLIIQYGNKVYNSFNEVIEGTGLVSYPAPFGKTIYIPLAIMVLKSGITDLNADVESIIIDRRWIEVDQENTGYADYVARAQSEKSLQQSTALIDGTIPAGKADSLKCTIGGKTEYKNGDYYLNYDNLIGSVSIVNNLTTSTYDKNKKEALSAYQGHVLDQNKFDKAGGTISGNILPETTNTYILGSKNKRWNGVYTNILNTSGNATIGGNLSISGTITRTGTTDSFVYSTGSSVLDLRAMSKSDADDTSFNAGTVVVCW